jgi:rare lipoprotein A
MNLGGRWGGGSGTPFCAVAALCLLANCSGADRISSIDPRYGGPSSARLIAPGEPVPKGGGVYQVGKPYSVGGRTYVPAENPNYRAEGAASWYGEDFHGHATANGEIFDMHSLSAAHPTLPIPSYVRVTNLSNHRSVIVRVNDRGPYYSNRVIDVSIKTATLLGFLASGTASVRVEYVGRAPLEGSDDGALIATLREGTPAPAPSDTNIASGRPVAPTVIARGGSSDMPIPLRRPYSLGNGSGVAVSATRGSEVSAFAPSSDSTRDGLSLPSLSLRGTN